VVGATRWRGTAQHHFGRAVPRRERAAVAAVRAATQGAGHCGPGGYDLYPLWWYPDPSCRAARSCSNGVLMAADLLQCTFLAEVHIWAPRHPCRYLHMELSIFDARVLGFNRTNRTHHDSIRQRRNDERARLVQEVVLSWVAPLATSQGFRARRDD
jgi:hypothetical protein